MGPQLRMDDDAENDCLVCERRHECVVYNEETSEADKNPNLLHEFYRRRKERGPIQSRHKWIALIFGQFIALVATSMNASSYALEYGMHRIFPMFLLFNSYLLLTLHLLWSGNCSNKKSKEDSSVSISAENKAETHSYHLPLTSLKLRTPWYYYLCLSCLDIGPNYLTLLAMKNTSFTSATLLGSLTIPSTMIFCSLLLGKEYRQMQYVGVILCMMGGSITVFTDMATISSFGGETAHPHSYRGDILAIVASLGYGVGDACAEFWSKHVDREEYLGMIGLFGAIATLTLSLVYERHAVQDLFAADKETMMQPVGIVLCYVSLLVAYYVLESLFLLKSDATLLNLSLQTSNFWAFLYTVLVFRETPQLLFYVSIFMVTSGVFVYELYGNETTLGWENTNDYTAGESSPLNSRQDRLPYHTISTPYTLDKK